MKPVERDDINDIFECDPVKNECCMKTSCEFNLDIPEAGRFCSYTTNSDYEWDGKSERMGHYGAPFWMKEEGNENC